MRAHTSTHLYSSHSTISSGYCTETDGKTQKRENKANNNHLFTVTKKELELEGKMDSAQTDTVTDLGQEGGESQFNRNAPKCEQSKAQAHPEL